MTDNSLPLLKNPTFSQDDSLYSNDETARLISIINEKDQLVRTVAHDLRNPLGGIMSLASLMIQEDEFSEDQAELLNSIKAAAEYSLKLVEELLTVRQETLSPACYQEVDIHELIMNYLRYSEHLLDRKNQKLSLNFLEGEAYLMADKEKITRVLDNLIGNAMKFTPNNGEISINTQVVSNGLQITVKDNGVGIPEHVQPYVFSGPEGRRTGTSGEKSHGLGLSICKKIVESYGGTIHFQSRQGKGTNFYIWLPKVTFRSRMSA